MKIQEHLAINKEGILVGSQRISIKNKKSDIDYNVMNIGFYLLVPILCGIFLGLLFDSKFHTHKFSVYAGIIIGTVASFYNLIKLIKNNA